MAQPWAPLRTPDEVWAKTGVGIRCWEFDADWDALLEYCLVQSANHAPKQVGTCFAGWTAWGTLACRMLALACRWPRHCAAA